MNIARKTQQVLIVFNKKAFKSSLKKVTNSLVFYIIPACVSGSQPLHALRNIGLIGFQEQMIVVVHEHIGINFNLEPFRRFPQDIQKQPAVIIITENISLFISS